MAENTKIAWCDHTWNTVLGCRRKHIGCLNCYAQAYFKRMGIVGKRRRTSDANWQKPLKWNRKAEIDQGCFRCVMAEPTVCTSDLVHKTHRTWVTVSTSVERLEARGLIEGNDGNLGGWLPLQNAWQRPRVFVGSLMDAFEDWQGPIVDSAGRQIFRHRDGIANPLTMTDLRHDMYGVIDQCQNLTWILLTKRPENILEMWFDVESHERKNCSRCGKPRRVGNRRARSRVASGQENLGQMEQHNAVDSLHKSQGRGENRVRVFASTHDEKPESHGGSSAPLGMALFQRPDSEGAHDQPQEREEGGQPAKKSRTSHNERTAVSRTQSIERQQKPSKGIKTPENEADGKRCANHSATSTSGGTSQSHRLVLHDESAGCQCDLLPTDVDAHLNFRPNCWLLYSASDQETLEAGIGSLLECRDLVPVLGLSLEPLIGPVTIPFLDTMVIDDREPAFGGVGYGRANRKRPNAIGWVICGAESGPNRRPMEIDWMWDIYHQCKAAGVRLFIKQDNHFKPGQQGRIPDKLWAVKQFPEVKHD